MISLNKFSYRLIVGTFFAVPYIRYSGNKRAYIRGRCIYEDYIRGAYIRGGLFSGRQLGYIFRGHFGVVGGEGLIYRGRHIKRILRYPNLVLAVFTSTKLALKYVKQARFN